MNGSAAAPGVPASGAGSCCGEGEGRYAPKGGSIRRSSENSPPNLHARGESEQSAGTARRRKGARRHAADGRGSAGDLVGFTHQHQLEALRGTRVREAARRGSRDARPEKRGAPGLPPRPPPGPASDASDQLRTRWLLSGCT